MSAYCNLPVCEVVVDLKAWLARLTRITVIEKVTCFLSITFTCQGQLYSAACGDQYVCCRPAANGWVIEFRSIVIRSGSVRKE